MTMAGSTGRKSLMMMLFLVLSAQQHACSHAEKFGDVVDEEEREHPWEKESLTQHLKDERLFHACQENDPKRVRAALKIGAHHHHHVNGYTPLMQATWMGHHEIVKILLDAGAHVDQKDAYGRTSLMIAAINGELESGKLLVEAGANLFLKQRDSHRTALQLAQTAAQHPDAPSTAQPLADFLKSKMDEIEEQKENEKVAKIEELKAASAKKKAEL